MELAEKKIMNLNFTFRYRLEYLRKKFLSDGAIDAILVILCKPSLTLAFDSNNNIQCTKLFNWLVFGHSSILELENKTIPEVFLESFLLITKDTVFIFGLNSVKDYFYELVSKVRNMNFEFFFLTRKENADTEILQLLKIAKFVEKTHSIKSIAIPLSAKETGNKINLEKWPLINATGLSSLGEGFFTMKHNIVNISTQ
jgi:hypothetical protein